MKKIFPIICLLHKTIPGHIKHKLELHVALLISYQLSVNCLKDKALHVDS